MMSDTYEYAYIHMYIKVDRLVIINVSIAWNQLCLTFYSNFRRP